MTFAMLRIVTMAQCVDFCQRKIMWNLKLSSNKCFKFYSQEVCDGHITELLVPGRSSGTCAFKCAWEERGLDLKPVGV